MSNVILILIVVVISAVLVGGYFIYYPRQGSYAPVSASAVCISDWQCQWRPCVNGNQTEGAVDLNNCGTGQSTIACPALARLCAQSGPR